MDTTPRRDGFHMPPEFASHQRTLMAWPARTVGVPSWWTDNLDQAKDDWAAMRAPSRASSGSPWCPTGMSAEVRHRCGEGVESLELPIDDSWMRDNGPIFVTNEGGEVAMVHFRFNSWGEKYLPYDKDARVPELLAEEFGVRRYEAPMVLEGGSFFVDGGERSLRDRTAATAGRHASRDDTEINCAARQRGENHRHPDTARRPRRQQDPHSVWRSQRR